MLALQAGPQLTLVELSVLLKHLLPLHHIALLVLINGLQEEPSKGNKGANVTSYTCRGAGQLVLSRRKAQTWQLWSARQCGCVEPP